MGGSAANTAGEAFRWVADPGGLMWPKDRKTKVTQDYYGGSKEAYKGYRKEFRDIARKGDKRATAYLNYGRDAVNKADMRAEHELRLNNIARRNQRDVRRDATSKMDMYDRGYRNDRGRMVTDATALRKQAIDLEKNYQQTADRQFALNQGNNLRAMQSMAASGGSAGSLREAMATGSEANANAAAQAEITRANEYNALQGMKANIRQASAGITSDIAAKDQYLNALNSGRQASALAADESLINQRDNIIGNNANRGLAMSSMGTTAGLASQVNGINALSNVEGSQVAANADYKRALADAEAKRHSGGLFGGGGFLGLGIGV